MVSCIHSQLLNTLNTLNICKPPYKPNFSKTFLTDHSKLPLITFFVTYSFLNKLNKIKLTEFFEWHNPSEIFLNPKIADKFSDHQEVVFKHLAQLYAEKENHAPVTEETLLSLIPPPHQGAEPV
jgi:hypothetical protein